MAGAKIMIKSAVQTSPIAGRIELIRDWHGETPPIRLDPRLRLIRLTRLEPFVHGLESGFYFDRERVFFVFDPVRYPWAWGDESDILLGGEFNGWNPWQNPGRWTLKESCLGGHRVLMAEFGQEELGGGRFQFKFATSFGDWLSPPDAAPNAVRNESWNANLELDPASTGHHQFEFEVETPLDLRVGHRVLWGQEGEGEGGSVPLVPGDFFHLLSSDLPMGAMPGRGSTLFRLFAPRATGVEVFYYPSSGPGKEGGRLPLRRLPDGVWEAKVRKNLHGWHYHYRVDGADLPTASFDPTFRVIDPWAKALAGTDGPGIVIDAGRLPVPARRFVPPRPEDLVMAELHLRDVLALSPLDLDADERSGFSGLARWIEEADYLTSLGVNAVELLPVQEFDNRSREEYHWGYMPVNYFGPESSYARNPETASQIQEFAAVVEAFHRKKLAVVMDVVYNHVGNPNSLLHIDKQYYFDLDGQGGLMNWSGCGNDLRGGAAMTRRLIIDSLLHLVRTFDVDGFRFDLAELLGVETLRQIEKALRREKPGIILIAEPWSFRGHVARQLRGTSYSSWNDGFREFLPEFVRGRGDHGAVRYFLTGSPGHFAAWPGQTLNYTESHDDRTWIDKITQCADHNGISPTETDQKRTRLMAGFLFASIGIPMIAAGQDFLRSKQGVSNTYQRGDLNALDYGRLECYAETHRYFADWIRFRLSPAGRVLRPRQRPSEDYFHFSFAEGSPAFMACFNADRSAGGERVTLAINPCGHPVKLSMEGFPAGNWKKMADENRFHPSPRREAVPEGDWEMPPQGLGLWVEAAG